MKINPRKICKENSEISFDAQTIRPETLHPI